MSSWSTRAKVGITFGLLALVAFGGIGWLSGHWVQRQVTELQSRRLTEDASRMANALDIGLFERLREIANLAATWSADGATLSLTRGDLERLKATYPFYVWIGATNAQGVVLAATGGLLEGRNVSARLWWKAASKAAFVGDVHEAQLLKSLLPPSGDEGPLRLIDVSAPIRDGDLTVGVLGAHLSWEWAGEVRDHVMAQAAPDDAVEMFLFDAVGDNLRLTRSAHLDRPLVSDLSTLSGVQAVAMEWNNGKRYLTSAVQRSGYRDFAGLGWTVVVRQPLEVTAAPARRLRNRIWALGALGAGLLATLGWWSAGRLLRPLREVADAAQAESAGEAAPEGGDEVRRLSHALGDLVARLRSREAELMQITSDLEQRVVHRTEELERRNADLRGMARMVSHDVRGAIGSVAQALRLAAVAETGRRTELIELATRECEHVGEVLEALLWLSVSESRPLESQTVDMAGLAAAAVERQRLITGFAGLVELGALPAVKGDPVLLGQVWDNLIGNAMKFSRLGDAPRIVVAARKEEEVPLPRWQFEVVDNGVGFESAKVGRLFNAFERLHRDGRYPGTGLGLSIVQRIIQRHGGAVKAEGAVGRGANFGFTLPITGEA